MPKRQNVRRVDSKAVQGDDSYIVLNSITWRKGRDIEDNWEEWTDEKRVEVLAPTIAEWNWVDDDGNPLPQPKDNPDIVRDMTLSELEFVVRSLGGERKN